MKLAVYSHYFLPEIGAPSSRIGDFAREWTGVGHDVHVATCFPNHPTGIIYPGYNPSSYQHERLNGVNVHRSWTYVTPNKGIVKKTLGHATLWVSAGWTSSRRMPAPDCTIGTSPTFFAAMAARSQAKRYGIPFIMEVRDLWPAIFVDLGVVKSRAIIRILEMWEMNLYRSATRIVTVTEAFRKNLISRGVRAEKVATITNGADTSFWRATSDRANKLREELGLRGKFVVLYIGAHGISQGLAAQLRAAAKLADVPEVQFLFVGEGADKERLEREASLQKLRNVRFLASVGKEQVRDFYTMADVCLVPLRNISLFDTFIPSKMFEIMSIGRPIIGSLRGEAAEILSRSGAARVVPPEDDIAIAGAVLELLKDPNARAEMRRNGPGFVQTHYSRAVLATRYGELIKDARDEMGLKFV